MPAIIPILIGISAAGTATTVVSQIKAGNAAKKAGLAQQAASESQADLTEYNADVAGLQAADAIARGAEEENRYRTQVRGIIGSQRAAFAGNNVDVGFGSAVDVQADAAFLGELDALTIRTNAAREAWGYNVQGEDLRRGAAIARREGTAQAAAGRQMQSAARWQAGGSILSGTGSLLQIKYGMGGKG